MTRLKQQFKRALKKAGLNEMATYTKGQSVKLSKNFSSHEFDCKGKGCCSKTTVDPLLVDYLQKIRDKFGVSITINSGYRCSKHNKAVGGAASSKHTMGMAADIVCKGVKPLEVAKYAESIGILGIGLYDTFVHIDTRTSKSFWYSHKQEYRSTFGGKKAAKPAKTPKAESAKSFSDSVKGTYKTTAGLNVRYGAGVTKGKMVTIPEGHTVNCYGFYTKVLGTNWLYVQFIYKDTVYMGFASSKYLDKQ